MCGCDGCVGATGVCLVAANFGNDINIPKTRAIREILDLNLFIFNCTSFYDGREVESSGGDLKRLKSRHSNYHCEGDKDVMVNRATRLAFHYLLAGGRFGNRFRLRCGNLVHKIPHPTKDAETHPLLVSFFKPPPRAAKRVSASSPLHVKRTATLGLNTHQWNGFVGI